MLLYSEFSRVMTPLIKYHILKSKHLPSFFGEKKNNFSLKYLWESVYFSSPYHEFLSSYNNVYQSGTSWPEEQSTVRGFVTHCWYPNPPFS